MSSCPPSSERKGGADERCGDPERGGFPCAVVFGDIGWVVPVRDAAAQAAAMREAIKALRDRERVANEFVIERMVERYRKIWQNAVLSNHGGISG